jgi:hypothetical protein
MNQDLLPLIEAQMAWSREFGRPPYITVEHADWLLATVKRQRGLLKRLEWAVVDPIHSRVCPACDGVQPDHEPRCELAAELAHNDEDRPLHAGEGGS